MPAHRSKCLIFTAFLTLTFPIVAYEKPNRASELKNLPAGENILWSDPGEVEARDFVYGVGGQAGAPRPPFQFLKEDLGGTTPKVTVRDAGGRTWSVKFGIEVKPSVFSTRLVWACGYVVETEYFVGQGHINGVHDLGRARAWIQGDGSFADARFQLRSDSPKFLEHYNWAWSSNPFVGTQALNGLKILVMLLSNWDTKDARDFGGTSNMGTADSNLSIFQSGTPTQPKYLYFVSDWGASLGKWGAALPVRSKWNCRDYRAQTPDFVRGMDHGSVRFGFVGKHNDSIVQGIQVTDVQWLLRYLGRITDDQLRRGLAASGATPDEIDCYLQSIRQRIDQLRRLVR